MQTHKSTLQQENSKSGQTVVPVRNNGQGRQQTPHVPVSAPPHCHSFLHTPPNLKGHVLLIFFFRHIGACGIIRWTCGRRCSRFPRAMVTGIVSDGDSWIPHMAGSEMNDQEQQLGLDCGFRLDAQLQRSIAGPQHFAIRHHFPLSQVASWLVSLLVSSLVN